MLIVWGYKNGIYNKKFLGIKPCESCGKFAETYLARSYFQVRLFYVLPIFGIPTGRYLRCANCSNGRKLTNEEWKTLKAQYADIPKRKNYLKAYDELKKIVLSSEADKLDADTVYSALMGKLDFSDDGRHIRELVDVYLSASANALARSGQLPAEEAEAASESAEADAASVRSAETADAAAMTGISPETAALLGDKSAPAASAAPAATAVPVLDPNAFESDIPTGVVERSKARYLWLLLAIPMALFALFMLVVGGELLFDNTMESVEKIFTTILCLIPAALDVLFFRLALKKYKKI